MIEYILEQGWILGRLTHRGVSHVFDQGHKSFCGLLQKVTVVYSLPGTEQPVCKNCMRRVKNEHNKS